jgi:NitT/TauT family transport system substrate-binding protein
LARSRFSQRRFPLLAAALALALGCSRSRDPSSPLRLGFFPNLTHAQALVGYVDGTFARTLGGQFDARQFNAGPAAMEALLAGDLDMSYVGATPAIIAYVRSSGRLRVVAGAVSGGAALVVRDARRPEDLKGKKVASPQVGNTQDVALRFWLTRNGLDASDLPSREVSVLPMNNAQIFGLFSQHRLDAAWVPEPWVSRLVREAGARILVDERSLWPRGQFPTTVLVATEAAIAQRRKQVEEVIRANAELTARWKADPASFARSSNEAFEKLTGKKLSPQVLEDAFSRLAPTTDPMEPALIEEARRVVAVGYLGRSDFSRLVDRSFGAAADQPGSGRKEKGGRRTRKVHQRVQGTSSG